MWSTQLWCDMQVHNIEYLILEHSMNLNCSYFLKDWLLAFNCYSVKNSRSHRKSPSGDGAWVNEVSSWARLEAFWFGLLRLLSFKIMACFQYSSSSLLSSPEKKCSLTWRTVPNFLPLPAQLGFRNASWKSDFGDVMSEKEKNLFLRHTFYLVLKV